jgi:flavin reductase (DIM6/NTAB) family NADH-FMN oxidoreductase RutF
MPADAPKPTQRPITQHLVAPGGASEADQDAYKLLSTTAAKGVAVVTAVHRGWDNAVTVTDYLSVSYDPPTMVVSLYALSRMAEALAETGRWGLSLLAADQRAVADVLGEQGSPLDALLRQIPHFRREDGAPPLIAGALSWFELRTTAMHEAATHLIFVGEVVAMGRAAPGTRAPLVRFQSGYLH